MTKPYKGVIKDWSKYECEGGLGYLIRGEFVGHPTFHGYRGCTSCVVYHDEVTGVIETNNSTYTLDRPPEPVRHKPVLITRKKSGLVTVKVGGVNIDLFSFKESISRLEGHTFTLVIPADIASFEIES